MRLRHHRPIRTVALAATTAMLATMLALVFGAQVGLAADYQDKNHNVCEGNGTSETAVGCPDWKKHVTGEYNVALGDEMMPALTGGTGNVALNSGALASNTTGSANMAIGDQALFSNTTGQNNVALGARALRSNTTGENNLASGSGALEFNKTGRDNIATGNNALFSNTTGSYNVASGSETLIRNTTGHDNIASGNQALQLNTTGNFNIATGTDALVSNTEGHFNLASGPSALFFNTTGSYNLALGLSAMEFNTTGTNNVASGVAALAFNTTGSSNVGLGNSAGKNLTTGSNNVDIANEGVAEDADTTRIGTEGKQTKAFIAGVNGAPLTGKLRPVKVNESGQLGTAKASSARLKEEVRGLGASAARVLSLRPVSFRYKPQFAQGKDQLEYGLIAEQVARLYPSLVQYGSDGKPAGVYYEELPVLLLAQLRREHARASRQQHQIDQLASEMTSLRAEMQTHR